MAKFRGKVKSKKIKAGGTTIGITADFSGLFHGIEIAGRRLQRIPEEVADRFVLPAYEKLILQTPVFQGQARMGWYVRIGPKGSVWKTKQQGSSGGLKAGYLRDPGVRPIAGMRDAPTGAREIVSGDPYDTSKGKKVNRHGLKDLTKVRTQTAFGKPTATTKAMVDEARAVIMKHYKPSIFGERGGSFSRSRMFPEITIGNDVPYIDQLISNQGNPGGWWRTRTNINPFVKNGTGYKRNYAKFIIANMRAQITRYLDAEVSQFEKSMRVRIAGYK